MVCTGVSRFMRKASYIQGAIWECWLGSWNLTPALASVPTWRSTSLYHANFLFSHQTVNLYTKLQEYSQHDQNFMVVILCFLDLCRLYCFQIYWHHWQAWTSHLIFWKAKGPLFTIQSPQMQMLHKWESWCHLRLFLMSVKHWLLCVLRYNLSTILYSSCSQDFCMLC